MTQTLAHQKPDPHTWLIDTGLNRPRHTACYLLHNQGELAFIDTGVSNNVKGLLRLLTELGFSATQLRWILPTHVHLDHAGGAGALLAHCPNAVLATHQRGLPHMIEPERLQQGAIAVYGEARFEREFGRLTPAPKERCQALYDGDVLPLGQSLLHFLDTPGHANHHGCFLHEASNRIYTGDSFGLHYAELDSPQRPWLMATTTPVAFDPEAWISSLDKMMATAADSAGLTHFGILDHPTRWRKLLQQSIEDHAEVALHEEKTGSSAGRMQRLEQILSRNLLRSALTLRPDLSADHVSRILGADIELNAKGLEVWLARRASHRS